jgi:hypothetical protein
MVGTDELAVTLRYGYNKSRLDICFICNAYAPHLFQTRLLSMRRVNLQRLSGSSPVLHLLSPRLAQAAPAYRRRRLLRRLRHVVPAATQRRPLLLGCLPSESLSTTPFQARALDRVGELMRQIPKKAEGPREQARR